MRINVTRAEIRAGIPTDPSSCAVALALAPHYPGLWVSVGEGSIYVLRGPSMWTELVRKWDTPPEVREWIERYDTCADPEACPELSFDLPE